MQQQILQLVTRHCETLRTEFAEIDRSFDAAHRDPDGAGLGPVTASAHKIKGSSGSLGFAEVSARAERLEVALRRLEGDPGRPGGLEALRPLRDDLGRAVSEIRPEQSSLYARFSGKPAT